MSSEALPLSTDLLVAGAGPGGLMAALLARAHGLDVTVIEKSRYVGGTTALSGGGIWLPANPLMAKDGIDDSVEVALEYLAAAVGDDGPSATPARQEAFVRGGIRALAFLRGLGLRYVRMNYPDYYPELPGGMDRPGRMIAAAMFDARRLGQARDWVQPRPPLPLGLVVDSADEMFAMLLVGRSWRARVAGTRAALKTAVARARGVQPLVLGAAHIGQLLHAALRGGVRIHRKVGFESLVTDGSRVVAAIVRAGDSIATISARRGVLLNCGGFAHDATLPEKFGPVPASTDWTATVPTDTGDGLRAACDIGAATALTDAVYWVPMAIFPGERTRAGGARVDGVIIEPERHLPHSIVVDQTGVRYQNEAVPYVDFGIRMYERHTTAPAIPSWLILDRRHRNRYAIGYTPPRFTPKGWARSGGMCVADTLRELAYACGIDPTSLIATVERFNHMAESGVDADFGRGAGVYDRIFSDPNVTPNPCLGTIERPPFYAIALHPGDVGCAGGLLTDEHARVLREDGTPIGGLYACGTTAASAMGRVYVAAGISLGQSTVFGYLAAEHMATSTRMEATG